MRHLSSIALSKGPYISSHTRKQSEVHDTKSGHLCAHEAADNTASIALRHQTHVPKFPVTQPCQL